MRNLSFIQLYQEAKEKPSPKDLFIHQVSEVTHRSESTVKKWVIGNTAPDINTMIVLAHHFDTPVEILFPTIKKKGI